MKKNIFAVLTIGVVLAIGFFIIKGLKNSDNTSPQAASSSVNSPIPPPLIPTVPADKIEVVHFHGTQQCWSCITVGEYALKTIKEKFPQEYQSGKIVFKDVNGELKENQELVMKYQTRGSSLFVNAINDGQDSIKEDTSD